MRRFIPACVGALALTCTATALAAQHAAAKQHSIGRAALAYYGSEIARFEKETWHWQRVMGVPRTPPGRGLEAMGAHEIQQTAELWRRRSAGAHRRAQHPPHLRSFLCIHHYEGSWTDAGAPYYGGLQMNLGFQQAYGRWLLQRKGTADHWSPLEQIWTAEKALRVRGFWPWPNTARFCGLL